MKQTIQTHIKLNTRLFPIVVIALIVLQFTSPDHFFPRSRPSQDVLG